MKRSRKRFATIALVFLLIWIGWIYRPYQSYDPEQVSPEIASLQEPFQFVESYNYLDGGTVGIHIVDVDGVERKFAIPFYSLEPDKNYTKLFFGTLHNRDPGATEIQFNNDTKSRILEILRQAKGTDRSRDITIARLSNRWRDYARIYARLITNKDYRDLKPLD